MFLETRTLAADRFQPVGVNFHGRMLVDQIDTQHKAQIIVLPDQHAFQTFL